MNMKKLLTLALLSVSFAFAANVVTFTASSATSQKEADLLALEGIAKQLKTRVTSETEVTRSEQKTEAGWKTEKSMSSSRKSSTDIVLKGATVVAGKKVDGKFTATASVDLDQMASKILIDVEKTARAVKAKDSIIRYDMLDRDYRKMTLDMRDLEKLVEKHDELLENLSYAQAVPRELLLEHTLGELTEFLMASLATVKIEADWNGETLEIKVSDFSGPLPLFPIAVTQNSKDLVNGKTDAKGSLSFARKQIAAKFGAGEVTVHPDLNFKYVRSADTKSVKVRYETAKNGASYKLVCGASAAECATLQKTLGDGGVNFVESGSDLVAALDFFDKKSSAGLVTSTLNVTLKTATQEIVETAKGVGKTAEDAHAKAIQKLPFAAIAEKLGK